MSLASILVSFYSVQLSRLLQVAHRCSLLPLRLFDTLTLFRVVPQDSAHAGSYPCLKERLSAQMAAGIILLLLKRKLKGIYKADGTLSRLVSLIAQVLSISVALHPRWGAVNGMLSADASSSSCISDALAPE